MGKNKEAGITYYIEVHKAEYMYTLIKGVVSLVSKLQISPIIKNTINTDLSKVLQFLALRKLKKIKDDKK